MRSSDDCFLLRGPRWEWIDQTTRPLLDVSVRESRVSLSPRSRIDQSHLVLDSPPSFNLSS